MRLILLLLTILGVTGFVDSKNTEKNLSADTDYLEEIREKLKKEWPHNQTINLVFHGHSVPAGYFNTPVVKTLDAYPYLVLRQLKEKYPFAVINVINTAIGGETSVSGEKRFDAEVLNHKPDILFIDYALNDRRPGLEASKKAWVKMIDKAKAKGIKIILLTPSPDLSVDMKDPHNELEKHANQIRALAKEYTIGLADSYATFQNIQTTCNCLGEYMSQSNHPNEKGHQLIASGIMRFFMD